MLTWNRALGTRLNVLGVIDPDTSKAAEQLAAKAAQGIAGYGKAKTWSSLSEAIPLLKNTHIDLGILGIPPHFRGTTKSPADTDLRLLGAWSKAAFASPVCLTLPGSAHRDNPTCQAMARREADLGSYLLASEWSSSGCPGLGALACRGRGWIPHDGSQRCHDARKDHRGQEAHSHGHSGKVQHGLRVRPQVGLVEC